MKAYIPVVYIRRDKPVKFPVILAHNIKGAVDEFLRQNVGYSLAVPLKGREFYATITGADSRVWTRRIVIMDVGLERK